MSAVDFTEKDLRLAVAAYCRDLCAPEPDHDPGHVFSERYNEQIKRILYMSRRQVYRKRAQRMIASLFIVLMLTFGAVMLFSEPARAAFVNWTVNIYNKIVDITFTHTGDDHAYIICTPGKLPEGFELTENYHSGYYTRSLYKNAEEQYIKFEYRRPTEKQKQQIEARSTGAETAVSAQGVKMFIEDVRNGYELFWYEPHQDLAYYVKSDLDKDTLIKCFDVYSLRLPVYEPAWIPEGYEAVYRNDAYPQYALDFYNADTGEYIYYSYTDAAETDLVFADRLEDDTIVEEVIINGNQGYYFPKTENVADNDMVIIDTSNHLVFTISAELDKAIMVRIAESIICKE